MTAELAKVNLIVGDGDPFHEFGKRKEQLHQEEIEFTSEELLKYRSVLDAVSTRTKILDSTPGGKKRRKTFLIVDETNGIALTTMYDGGKYDFSDPRIATSEDLKTPSNDARTFAGVIAITSELDLSAVEDGEHIRDLLDDVSPLLKKNAALFVLEEKNDSNPSGWDGDVRKNILKTLDSRQMIGPNVLVRNGHDDFVLWEAKAGLEYLHVTDRNQKLHFYDHDRQMNITFTIADLIRELNDYWLKRTWRVTNIDELLRRIEQAKSAEEIYGLFGNPRPGEPRHVSSNKEAKGIELQSMICGCTRRLSTPSKSRFKTCDDCKKKQRDSTKSVAARETNSRLNARQNSPLYIEVNGTLVNKKTGELIEDSRHVIYDSEMDVYLYPDSFEYTEGLDMWSMNDNAPNTELARDKREEAIRNQLRLYSKRENGRFIVKLNSNTGCPSCGEHPRAIFMARGEGVEVYCPHCGHDGPRIRGYFEILENHLVQHPTPEIIDYINK